MRTHISRTVIAAVSMLAASILAGPAPAAEELAPFTPATDRRGDWSMQVDAKLPNVLIMGDSISIGYTRLVRGILSGQANVYRPMRRGGKQPNNCGDTRMGIKNIDSWLGTTRWDVIHFNWGLWDLCYRNPKSKTQGNRDKLAGTLSVTPEEYERNLEALVTRLQATGAKLIWASTTVVPEQEAGRFVGDDAKYNAIAARVMQRHGIATDDLHALTKEFGEELFAGAGNVHYTPDGCARIAKQVAAEISAALPAAKNEGNANNRAWADRLEFVGTAVAEPEYHVWGSSPIMGPDGKTHLFVARWPVSATFDGWTTDCEIAHYVSGQPEGPFAFIGVVLQGTGTASWDKASPHNPTIQKVGDQYVLLYIANTGRDFPASQRIGMATAKNLDGPWKKVGADGLILSPPDDPSIWSHKSTVGVNNPALLQHPDGRFFLYYKAMKAGGLRRMGVAIAEKLEGPYVFHETPLTSNTGTIEDGYAFLEGGKIHLLTTDNDHGSGLLWTSDDGINFGKPVLGFDKMEHYVAKETLDAATNYRGKKFERPQVLIQNGQPTHLYVASGANLAKGRGSCSYVLRIKSRKP